MLGKELHIEIGDSPICPRCKWWGHDDWQLSKGLHGNCGPLISIEGSIQCANCSTFFKITVYYDGEIHSEQWRKRRAA